LLGLDWLHGAVSATPFNYDYLAASRQVTQVTFPNNAKIVNAFDPIARLWTTSLKRQDNTLLNKHDYVYNHRHERTKHTRFDGSYVNFGYDNLGQVTNALGYTSGGSPIAAEQLGYAYDAGWNMTQRSANGVPTSYTVNNFNQVTYDGAYGYSYDTHGNRTYRSGGGGWIQYTYDAEQRLIGAETDTSGTPAAYRWRSEFVYDGLSRLRIRREYTWADGGWSLSATTRYVYDGRRVIQERDGNNTPTVTYTRGPDVSGSLEGAGGIGGLLARSSGYSGGIWSTHHYYHADGGGNITALLDNHPSSASVAATYRYDPYGRGLSSSGSLAGANRYRFSSKEIHVNSGLYSYGFRFYDPTVQRWLNRDPLGEWEGPNLYSFVHNKPVVEVDVDGRTGWQLPPQLHQDPEFTRGFYEGAGSAFVAGCTVAATISPIPGDETALLAAALGRAVNVGSKALRAARLAKNGDRGAAKSEVTALTKFYPENAGFAGATERTFLMPGQTIDRYGGSRVSRFFSPQGTADWARSLPPGTTGQPLRTFEVVKPFEVQSGTVAPCFNQPGGGLQYRSPVQLEILLKRGIIKEVTP
jgi:RHS repeat-associated protein